MNVDELLANGNRLGAEASKQTGVPFVPTTITPSVKTGQPLDASSLGATTPLKVPEAIPQTTVASGIGGMASSIAETTGKALSDSVKADKEAKAEEVKSSKNALQSVFDQYLSTTASRQAEEEKAQIAQKAQATSDARAEAQTASNNIIASQRAQENEIAQLEKNLGGMSASALQGESQRINRQYAREQADLSLISLVANSKLNNANFDLATAQSIVDKKIENQLEPLRLQMDFAKMFYTENRDAFSKAEDREFNLLAQESERAYNTEKDNLDRIASLQLEAAKNGAPSSVIRAIGSAKTFDEAISKTGGYAVSIADRERQISPSGIVQRVDTQGNSLPPTAQDKALQVILGSGKFTKDQVAQVSNAINNGEDAFTVIKNQAKNIAGQTEATKITNYEVAQSQLDDVKTALSEYYKNGGKTNIFSGSYEKVINKLGEVDDPKLVALATQISSALQIYRNAVSGTAYSVQEGKDIASIFPGINKTQGLNDAILSGRKAAFASTIDGSYRSILGSVYDELKQPAQTKPTESTPVDSFLKQFGL